MDQKATPFALSARPRRSRGGRPPGVQIIGAFLRELRTARNLSTKEAHALALPDAEIEVESRVKAWTRWEDTGRLENRVTAERVARAMGTTVENLQGGPAPSRFDEIEQQLHRQAQAGNPYALAELSRPSSEEDAEHAIAERLATRIELAQLTRQSTRLNELAKVTGWTLGDLERPANLHGYWFVAAERAYGVSETRILVGVDDAIWHVQKEVLDWLYPGKGEKDERVQTETPRCPDARLTVLEEAPWFRVHLELPGASHFNRTISLVRCEPSEACLRWTGPRHYDREQLRRLHLRFWSDLNLIEGLKPGAAVRDLRRLRLVIEKRRRPELIRQALVSGLIEPEEDVTAVVQGSLDELDDQVLERFRAEGSSHSLVLNRLAQGLWRGLQPHLVHWPRECWELRPHEGSIALELNVRPRIAFQLGRQPRFALYRISLSELNDDGTLEPRPWRKDSVAETLNRLRAEIEALPGAPAFDQEFIGPPRPPGWPEPADD